MNRYIVSQDIEIMLNGSRYLLQKGDIIEITKEEANPEAGDDGLAGKIGRVEGGFPNIERSSGIIGHSRKTTPSASNMNPSG
jgi:hypothetical protein